MTLGLIAVGLLPAALTIFAAGQFALWSALMFAVLYGMSNGLMSIIKGIVPLSLFGRQGYGLVIGTLTTPQLILNAIAPTLFALVLDQVGPRHGLLIAIFFALASFAANDLAGPQIPALTRWALSSSAGAAWPEAASELAA